jgi:LysM repeat protein
LNFGPQITIPELVENMLITLVFNLIISLTLQAQGTNDPMRKTTRAEYIAAWKDVAIKNMRDHGIPASITLAQGILESGDGNSRLAREGNNHFGIKCHDWTGAKMYHDDDAKGECFRKYKNARESFEDHSLFLKRPRYAALFELKPDDYKGWAHGLKKAGYATNPRYPELLIRIIEENNLTAYDREAMSGKAAPAPKKESRKTKDTGDEIVLELGAQTPVFLSENKIKYVIAAEEETPESLARRLNMGPWQIRRYNDLQPAERIQPGAKVYIQPKRNKSAQNATHTLAPGETLRDVSQLYGVKMNRIRKYSGLEPNAEPKTGDVLKLKKR